VKFQADAKDLACAKDFTILSVAGRYSTGESPPIEAGHLELLPHLESTCTQFNTSTTKRKRPSAGPERSQQLQIPPSLNRKAILLRARLLFPFPAVPTLACANISVDANISPGAKFLASAKDFGCANVFEYIEQKIKNPPKKYLKKKYIYFAALIFLYIFCILI
jgi:hypothetical protein